MGEVKHTEADEEYAAMLARVSSVRQMVAAGIRIHEATDEANRVAAAAFASLIEYIDWLETAIAVGRGQWQSAQDARKAAEAFASEAKVFDDWHEDDGDVVWWAQEDGRSLGEPAWIGTPNDSDWPGYHTHWTPHPKFPELKAESSHGA